MRPFRLLALAVVIAGCLSATPAARADNVTLSVLTTSGQADPVASVSRIFAVTGTSTTPKYVYVTYRPTGGAACAATAQQDTGSILSGFWGFEVNGNFDKREAVTWERSGAWMFCMWIADSRTTVSTPITQSVTFRVPSATVSATFSPTTPTAGQPVAVQVIGSTEAPRLVYARVRPAGAPCAQTFNAESGEGVVFGDSVNGLFGINATTTFSTPGNYVICLWVASDRSDAAPVAGPQLLPVTVVAPTPVVSSAQAYNCSTGRRVTKFRVRSVPSVCLRYTFSAAPISGAAIALTFVRPGGKAHSRVRTTWSGQSQLQLSSLGSRAYKHRRGKWRAELRIDGVLRSTTSFTVKR